MQKCVCDICNKKEANNKLRVKQARDNSGHIIGRRWVNIDICNYCYQKFLELDNSDQLENMISKLVDGYTEKFNTTPEQEAYLAGLQDVIDLLTKKRIANQS